tara:strand:+ start:1088 stop:2329 length:1242 start_codon:yes stop_codon:yes gene_type:complete
MSKIDKTPKILFFITANFPFGNGETFIETEINYLSEAFDQINIISHDNTSKKIRKIPNNVKIERYLYDLTFFQKCLAIFSFFDKIFWNELKVILFNYKIKLSVGILKTMLISLFNAKRLKKIYKKEISNFLNNNLYLYSYWCNDSSLALALLKKEKIEITSFCRMHRWDIYFEESKYNYLPYRSNIISNLNSTFSISSDGIKYCETNWLVNSDKFKLSRLGVSNDYNLKKINHKMTLISCSNLISVKRVDLIIDSLSMIKDIKIDWIHIGDGNERIFLENKAHLLLNKNINYKFAGRMSNVEVYQYYKFLQPDLFINLSSSEGVPVSIMEAMSFGIPVIATSVGGNPEIVNNNNGYLISKHADKHEISLLIKNHFKLGDKEKNIKMNDALETWYNNYNADKNYSQFIDDILLL